jgi:hypothetical protein
VFDRQGAEIRVLQANASGRLRLVQHLSSPAGTPDGFGTALAAWGGVLVVSAPLDGDGKGAAYVYKKRGKLWHLQQKLIAADAEPGAEFGFGLDVRGDVIVIAASQAVVTEPSDDACSGFSSNGSGAVYVFVRRGGIWSETQKVLAPDVQCSGNFGHGVWLGKDRLVAQNLERARFWDDGYANIFVRNGDQFDVLARASLNPQGFYSFDVGNHELFFGEAEPNFSHSIGQVAVAALRPAPPLE